VSRVLLVCPEPLGHRQPAGIGIRFLEMEKVLRAAGHAVTLLGRDDITPERLHDESGRHDVAVVQGHAANDLFAHAQPLPVVVDLYDPYIIENLHYHAARGAEVFTHDHATLVNSLIHGDLFLCASEAQRFFYLGALLAAGRLNPVAFESDAHLDNLIRIAPFGVPPPMTIDPTPAPSLLFGGIYDWYDPIVAIDAVAIARRSLPALTLTFTQHPNPELTPQGKTAEAMSYARRKKYGFVQFEEWAAYDDRVGFYRRFAAALLTFPQSIETDLSMRTRIYDYLWAGLPIVTSSAPGMDEILERYGAGAIVRSHSADDFARTILNVLARRTEMVAGTQRFVGDHQWPRTLQPLADFCRAPKFAPAKEEFAVRLQVPERPPTILDRLKRRIGGSV